MRTRRGAFMLAFAAICVAAPPARAQLSAARWRASQVEAAQQSERIMREADKHRSLLAQFQVMRSAYVGNTNTAFHLIFGQYLSWYQTFVGDYPAASASFSVRQVALADDAPSPAGASGFTAKPAIEAIAELARGRRAVFFNEAHNVPLTRTLTVQMLTKLRAEGFNYFAAETLYQTDADLARRGYPVRKSGFYTREPICAEMVRTALKLGFKVVGYEALSDATGNAREAEQAHNLYRDVFARDPSARLVVDAGYAHIQESGVYLGGKSMAQHLRKLSGIDPLTIEQTMLFPHQNPADDHPYYAPVMAANSSAIPLVFVNADGKPWALRPGYDVSVFFPPQRIHRGRPTWLALGDLRMPYFVSGERCDRTYPCMVAARYAGEGDDAIPADRLVLDPAPPNASPDEHVRYRQAAPVAELYLRPGSYRLAFTDSDGHVLFRQNVEIGAGAPVAAATSATTAR